MWLTKIRLAQQIEQAHAEGMKLPDAVMEAFNRRHYEVGSNGEPRIFKRAGDVAEIMVEGVLTPKPDFYAYYYGGGNTTYPEIIQSLALAGADPSIKRLVLNISSPGGYVGGLFDALAALEMFAKPKETFASMADSAAYAIAALGGKITATNVAAEFGSVGVCATYVQYDFEKVYEITSTNAPNKRPDPSTPEGQAVIRKQLDAIEEIFVDCIARGRGTTKDLVIADFGRGEVLLANEAKRLKMIDKIAKAPQRSLPAENGGYDSAARAEPAAAASVAVPAPAAPEAAVQQTPAAAAPPAPAQPAPQQDASAVRGGADAAKVRKPMNEQELQAQHPEVYSAVLNKGKVEGEKGKAEAVSAAIATERDRVEGHLIMGEASGEMKIALESVRSGATMTVALQAKYMAAGMNRRDTDARAADDVAAAGALGAAAGTKEPGGKSMKDQIADEIEAQTKGTVAA
jgi:ClpP class serine protease